MADETTIEIPQPKQNHHVESSLVRSPKARLESNSLEKKDEAKVAKSKIRRRELTFKEKLKRSFVKEDLTDIRDYIIFDIIVPSVKQGIFNTIVGTAGQLFGVSVPANVFRYTNTGYNGNPRSHEARYRDYSSIDRANGRVRQINPSYNSRLYIKDFVFDYAEEARATLEALMDICDSDGWVSVAQFFEIADPEGTIQGRNAYTNNNYGWTNVDNARVEDVGDGFIITLPPSRPRYN